MCLFEFIQVEEGATFMKHFKGQHKLQKFRNLWVSPLNL
jgi:hypothetical protein